MLLKRFLHVSIANKQDLESLIEEGECTSIEDCDWESLQNFDYAQQAIIDIEKKDILYWNDNIHSNPQEFMDGFKLGLDHSGVKYEIKKAIMTSEELHNSEYTGVSY